MLLKINIIFISEETNSTWVNRFIQQSIYFISTSFLGGDNWTRTSDLTIMSRLLYQLSYITKLDDHSTG